MPMLQIPHNLRVTVDNRTHLLRLEGRTFYACLNDAVQRYPALAPYLFNSNEELLDSTNIYLNEQDIRDILEYYDDPLIQEKDILEIVP